MAREIPIPREIAVDHKSRQTTPSGTRFFLPALDGVRALAFLLVFFLHSLAQLSTAINLKSFSPFIQGVFEFGREGVPLFFVLSAFLVTTLLMKESERTGKIDVWAFLIRRALRLWPLYYLLVLVTIFSYYFVPSLGVNRQMIFGYTFFVGDFYHMRHRDGSFVYLWSIGVEEKFYICWSIALAFLAKRGGTMAVAWMLIIGAWGLRLATAGNHEWSWLSYGPFAYLDCFGYGILLALRPDIRVRIAPWQGISIFLVGLWLATSMRFFIDEGDSPSYGFAIKMGVVALLRAWLLAATKDNLQGWAVWRPLRELGKLSYGAYMFHWPLFMLAWNVFPNPYSIVSILLRPGIFVATIILAFLSYRYFEMPFLRLKERFQKVPSREPEADSDALPPSHPQVSAP